MRGIRSDVQDALRRLDQHAARTVERSKPEPTLPWMRACVANDDKGVATFDLTFHDINTGERVAPTAEAIRGVVGFLQTYAEAYERKQLPLRGSSRPDVEVSVPPLTPSGGPDK